MIKPRSMGAERQILLFSLLVAIYQKTGRDVKGARPAGRSLYETLRGLKSVDVHERVGYLPGCHPFCVHGNNLLVNIRYVFLALLDHLRLKGRFPVLRYFNLHPAIAGRDVLALIPVPRVVTV